MNVRTFFRNNIFGKKFFQSEFSEWNFRNDFFYNKVFETNFHNTLFRMYTIHLVLKNRILKFEKEENFNLKSISKPPNISNPYMYDD